MTDAERLLQQGASLQKEDGLEPPSSPPSMISMKLWVFLAALLVLISLGIEIFWPLPAQNPPPCVASFAQHGAVSEKCVLKNP